MRWGPSHTGTNWEGVCPSSLWFPVSSGGNDRWQESWGGGGLGSQYRRRKREPLAPTQLPPQHRFPPPSRGRPRFRLPLKVQGSKVQGLRSCGKDREGALPSAQRHFPSTPTLPGSSPPPLSGFLSGLLAYHHPEGPARTVPCPPGGRLCSAFGSRGPAVGVHSSPRPGCQARHQCEQPFGDGHVPLRAFRWAGVSPPCCGQGHLRGAPGG